MEFEETRKRILLRTQLGNTFEFRDYFDIEGDKLHNLIDNFTDKQFNYLWFLYHQRPFSEVIKFFEDKLPRNKNPRPF